MRLLIATTNRHKVAEITRILEGMPIQLATLEEWPAVAAPDETGRSFEENARQKAGYYARIAGELTVAEDSGLEIDALHGAPGVESARYGGVDASYSEKFKLIYDALRAGGEVGSPARFVCALTLATPDQPSLVDIEPSSGLAGRILFETRGIIEGRIAPEPRGTGGFGYDPIFFYPPYGCTLAEMTADRKAAVSHRGHAFRSLRQFLAVHNYTV